MTPAGAAAKYLTAVVIDQSGLVADAELPSALPYGLTSRHFLRTVEDVQELIHDLNSLLDTKSYGRLEDLMDPAGFSGLLSRSVADRLERAGRGLVVNKYHNGYPDLIPAGKFPKDAVPHSDEGVEVKASREESSWQSHGPRAGWFVVVQFQIDDSLGVPTNDREPTHIVAAMAAVLSRDDWNWQPAKPGRIRSGTASVKPEGVAKLRNGAIWVRPEYRDRHDALRVNAILYVANATLNDRIKKVLKDRGLSSADAIASEIGTELAIPGERLTSRVGTRLGKLAKTGDVKRLPGRLALYDLP